MYLTADDRTGVLLEAIEDAEIQLDDRPGESDAETLLRHVIATAKRHYNWPANERKRLAEYEAKKKVAETPVAEAPAPPPEDAVVAGPIAF